MGNKIIKILKYIFEKDSKFNCELNYYRVNKSILTNKVIKNYNIDVIYKGEIIKKSGYVNLKYKLIRKNKIKISLAFI